MRQLQLRELLHFSDAAYGLGASLFFVTYVLFEIPSNLLLKRWGARRLFSAIMLGWGATSTSMLFIHTPQQFYAGRLLLGMLEAGFYPGVIYYLSTWLPQDNRSKAFAIFASGIVRRWRNRRPVVRLDSYLTERARRLGRMAMDFPARRPAELRDGADLLFHAQRQPRESTLAIEG